MKLRNAYEVLTKAYFGLESRRYAVVLVPRSRVVVEKDRKRILSIYSSGRVEFSGTSATDRMFLKAVQNLEGVQVST